MGAEQSCHGCETPKRPVPDMAEADIEDGEANEGNVEGDEANEGNVEDAEGNVNDEAQAEADRNGDKLSKILLF
uniref:Uncharacterized protein n=2 Tax=Meloidogyne javanica TaxID=6303 RepID=A0A915LZ37_MELJA